MVVSNLTVCSDGVTAWEWQCPHPMCTVDYSKWCLQKLFEWPTTWHRDHNNKTTATGEKNWQILRVGEICRVKQWQGIQNVSSCRTWLFNRTFSS